jgi:hypothetical protein
MAKTLCIMNLCLNKEGLECKIGSFRGREKGRVIEKSKGG